MLGLLVQSDDPTPSLINFLRGKRMLLILDSCEHVIETAAALAERIFEEAPQVHILATSRESLRVEGEHVHRLSPLGSPPYEAGLTAAPALDVPAVQRSAARHGVDGAQIVACVVSLVTKSLIAVSAGDTTTRYRLLDTTRAYAADKLVESGEADAIKRRHAVYYRELFERTETDLLVSTNDPNLRSELLGNARVALEWSFSSRDDVGIGTSLAAVAAPFLSELSLLTECHRLTGRALTALGDADRGTRREMELQASLGSSLMLTEGYRDEARFALTRALEIAEALGDSYFQMRLLRGLHNFHVGIGDFGKAIVLARRNEAVAKKTADRSAIAM